MAEVAKTPVQRMAWLVAQVQADRDLTAKDKDCAGLIAWHANSGTGQAHPGMDRLSEMLGISRNNISRHLNRLVEHGHLTKSRGGGRGRASVYSLVLHPSTPINPPKNVITSEGVTERETSSPVMLNGAPNGISTEDVSDVNVIDSDSVSDTNSLTSDAVSGSETSSDSAVNVIKTGSETSSPVMPRPGIEPGIEPRQGEGAEERYAFRGKVIRLKHDDHDAWKRRFHAIPDIDAELQALDDYHDRTLKPGERKSWFHRCSGALAKKHQKHIASAAEAGSAPSDDYEFRKYLPKPKLTPENERRRAEIMGTTHMLEPPPATGDPGGEMPEFLDRRKPKEPSDA